MHGIKRDPIISRLLRAYREKCIGDKRRQDWVRTEQDPHLTPEIETVYPTDSGDKWNLYTQENKEHSCCLKTFRNLIGDVELKNWKQVPLRQKN